MNTKIILKAIALFLAFNIFIQTLLPTIAYAVTSGATTPDVHGHQPIDATDNVNLANGDFNYTIPITSVPEYPMAIGYSNGVGMNHDAGMFGFGINGFTGAIARNIQGLPDDIKGATKYYNFDNQVNWKASAEAILSVGVNLPVPIDELGVSASGSLSLMVGYDNYKGVFGSLGFGAGVGVSYGGSGLLSGSLAVGLTSHSIDGASGSLGFRVLAYSYEASGTNVSSLSQGKSKWFAQIKGIGESVESIVDNFWNIGISDFSHTDYSLIGSLSPLANVGPTIRSFSVTTPAIPVGGPVKVKGSFSHMDAGKLDKNRKGYGFLYLNDYNSSAQDHLADLGVEGEAAFEPSARLNPVYLQRDFFSINSQGMGGTMQLMQNEHGLVSRNYNRSQFRNLGFIGLFTERKEIEPWHNVSRAVRNKGVDILALIKKSDEEGEKDFDKVIFNEKQLHNLRNEENLFDTKPILRMRGDLAGEFNLGSTQSTDFAVNEYELVHLSGTGGSSKIGFMKEEKDIPLYYPSSKNSTKNKYKNAGDLKSSNDIKYYTAEQVISTYNGLINIDPSSGTGDFAKNKNYAESFLSHYEYNRSGGLGKNSIDNFNSSNTKAFNLISHLNNLKSSYPNVNDVIADIRVKNPNGLQYVYNLPVFNKTTKTLVLKGKGVNAPKSSQSNENYCSLFEFGKPKQRLRQEVTDQFIYPYAWLLTAIVGPDYVDFDDVAGPSDGDLGYWVKIKYIKAADNFKWRIPYFGLEHHVDAIHNNEDDYYSMTSGKKEIYYVSEIESSEYTAKYFYDQRLDGVDAGGNAIWNGDAVNSLKESKKIPDDPTGSNVQFAVTKIELYKKHVYADHSKSVTLNKEHGKLVRATEFKYDYSSCPKTPDNITNYSNLQVPIKNVPYHIDYFSENNNSSGNGKLTLRKIQHISYEGGTAVHLPSYDLEYYFDQNGNTYNPEYNDKQVDEWGNYRKDANQIIEGLNYYSSYTELSKTKADVNSKTFKLSKVHLPGGGSIQVDFEAKDYSKVQNLDTYAMRQVKNTISANVDNTLTIKIDISDLAADSKTLSDIGVFSDYDLHGELAFYESTGNNAPSTPKEVYIARDHGKVVSLGGTEIDGNGRTYQSVTLKNHDQSIDKPPFISPFKKYLYSADCIKMKAIKETVNFTNCANVSANLDKYEQMEKDDPLDAARKIVANTRNYFVGDDNFISKFKECFGDPIEEVFPLYSYIRTPIYKGKYTGSRVKSLSFIDNFQYATSSTGIGTVSNDNIYTTHYYYDRNGDGTGVSEGVATIEPNGGYSTPIDILKTQGAGFMPSPTIMSAKTTVGLGYDKLSGAENERISRFKGKTEYTFITAKDSEVLFNNNFKAGDYITQDGKPNGRFFMFGLMSFFLIKFKIFKKKFKIKVPFWFPLTTKWKREDAYHLRSYSFLDNYDLLGRPLSIRNLDAGGNEVSSTNYNYLSKNNTVTTYNGTVSSDAFNTPAAIKHIRPGRTDQIWSESFYSKETSIELIPWILFLNAFTKRDFSYTNMKYTYLPPIMTGVETKTFDGKIAKSQFTGFDFYTGQPIETKTTDGSGKTIINRAIPAYWVNPEMGVSSLTSSHLNMLTPATATYTYLNSVDNSKLLSANVTKWSKSGWDFKNDLKIKNKVYDQGANTFKYAYETISSEQLNAIYQSNGKSRSNLDGATSSRIKDLFVQSSSFMYLPYKNYVLKQDLNLDGTFNMIAYNSNSESQNIAWQLVSQISKIDYKGNQAENIDILNKYAASQMGYNFASSLFTVANSPLQTSVYSGAENTYSVGGTSVVDDDRIKLGDAKIVKSCRGAEFIEKNIDLSNYISSQARLVDICIPINATANKAFAKLKVTYSHNPSIKRLLFVSVDENKTVRINSDYGESFNGFYVIPGIPLSCGNSHRLVFNPNDFSAFSLDDYFTQLGVSASTSLGTVPACPSVSKKYLLPDTECNGSSHTGNYAFLLEAGKNGTKFSLKTNTLSTTEQNRKLKFLVWVHASGSDNTALVIAKNGSILKKQYASNPFAIADDWKLVRLELDPSEYLPSDQLDFYVQNEGQGSVFYDDIRVQPYHSSMQSNVFDHETGRVTAVLNAENFATYYFYDEKGRISEVQTEVADIGRKTVKKYLYNEQKKN